MSAAGQGGGQVNPKVFDVALAEFKALRDEIGQRSTFSHTLININVVASGVVAGLVVNNPTRLSLLLLLPILSPVLGLLWLDHANNIRNIGDYIGSTLRTQIAAAAGTSREDVLGWEEHVDAYERRMVLRFLPFSIPLLLLFDGVPVASLARTATHLASTWQWILWVTGALLTAAFLLLSGRLFVQPFVGPREQ